MAWELMSDSRIGVRPTMVFFSETVFEVTNWAYSQAARRCFSGVDLRKVQEPASW
ncbi:hypothetical protein D3C73_1537140 [compost metagenome]